MGPLLHRPVSIRRPLSSATAALRAAASGRARHGAELLVELLDFEGSVALAHVLASPPLAPLTPLAGALSRVRRQLAEAEQDARRPLRDPHTGASLLSADRVASVLGRAGAPAARSRKAIEAAARELFAPLEARAQKRIGSSRRLVAEARRDLGPTIAASGPHGARLEQLDGALTAATAQRAEALVTRALGALGDAFAADLEHAVLALPKGPSRNNVSGSRSAMGSSRGSGRRGDASIVEEARAAAGPHPAREAPHYLATGPEPCPALPVAEWTEPGGFVAEHVARCEALVLASFLHERARLDMLVHSALGEELA